MIHLVLLIVAFVCIIIGLSNCWICARIPYEVHEKQVKEFTNQWDYGDFDTFLKEFNKRKWVVNEKYKNSLDGYKKGKDTESELIDSQIHASVIDFSGYGMIMETWRDYRKARKFVRNYYEENSKGLDTKRVEGLW